MGALESKNCDLSGQLEKADEESDWESRRSAEIRLEVREAQLDGTACSTVDAGERSIDSHAPSEMWNCDH
eukprot:3937530-Rhodomonas_salina.1